MKNYSFFAFLKKFFVVLFTPVYSNKGIYSSFEGYLRLNQKTIREAGIFEIKRMK
jgi:hypothetical protein